jgi:two-component system, cell cycle response regulator DivK
MPNDGADDRSRLVLIVDDSADNRAMYAEYLAFEGFRVLEAFDADEAIASAKANAPDAVVMDVVLPTIDGCEATRMLRADPATSKIAILALSGHTDSETRKRALDAGVDVYIEKPCLPHELTEHLRAILAGR